MQLVTLSSDAPWEKAYKGYNYLNVFVKGSQESKQSLDFTGLLAFDSVNQKLPSGCAEAFSREAAGNNRTFSTLTIIS